MPQFKLGRKRSPADRARFPMAKYLTATLPTPPSVCDYTEVPAAKQALSEMYGNDVLGDCVIACLGHAQGVISGNSGSSMIYSESQIVHLYSAIGGYVDGDPSTDNGCDIQTMLNHWKHHGAPIKHHHISGWIDINPENINEVRQAIWLFENLVLGMDLPDKWVSQMPSNSGFTWDVAGRPDPGNGHCVVGVGYVDTGVTIGTWGMLGTMTNAAIEEYLSEKNGGELYAVLSPNIIGRAEAKAPNGFDFEQLAADFAELG